MNLNKLVITPSPLELAKKINEIIDTSGYLSVPPGGQAGQVLVKNSSLNHDTKWENSNNHSHSELGGLCLAVVSESEYNNIASPDANTLYFIV